jgi:hypothetical protein
MLKPSERPFGPKVLDLEPTVKSFAPILKSLTPLTPRSKNHQKDLSVLRSGPSGTFINSFGKVPEGPDLRTIMKSQSSGTMFSKSQNMISPILSSKDKVRESLSLKFKSEYNSFMNKIERFNDSKSSESSESFESPCVPEFRSIEISETLKFHDETLDSKDSKIISELRVLSDSKIISEQRVLSESKIISEQRVLSESKVISIPKKDIMVYDLFSGNLQSGIVDSVPYLKFRKNPDNIVFVTSEDLDLEFFGYSKKELWNEVQSESLKEQSSKSFGTTKLFFTLQIVEEEDYHIPTAQIEHILENSHPIYAIEKDKRSFHLYNLIPVEFGT